MVEYHKVVRDFKRVDFDPTAVRLIHCASAVAQLSVVTAKRFEKFLHPSTSGVESVDSVSDNFLFAAHYRKTVRKICLPPPLRKVA